MPRSGAHARSRLERAALELYGEHGFDGTTIADIAARAGVTQRTFFRHFGDKREVLFNVEGRQRAALAQALADVPRDLAPMPAILVAFRSMARDLEANRQVAEIRHRIIAATPALHERELAKAAALCGVVANALEARGLNAWRAELLAEVTTAALGHVIHTWVANHETNVDDLLLQAFADLREFTTQD